MQSLIFCNKCAFSWLLWYNDGMPTGIFQRPDDFGLRVSRGWAKNHYKYVVRKTCKNCPNTFEVLKSRDKKQTCSRACANAILSEIRKKNNPGGFTKERASGSNAWNWKGGITPLIKRIRNSTEYKVWRKSVFERDNYTCVWCLDRSSKNNPVVLNADHIKSFAEYPELRFEISNGRTLCTPCHKKTPNYARNLK